MRVYDETRRRFGRPLTLMAAEELKERVGEGEYALILTNSYEMDGPPGAAAMARALILGLRAIPVIVANYQEGTKFERCLHQTCIGAGLIPVTEREQLFEDIWSPYTVLIRNWPARSVSGALEASKELLDEFRPKAVITVEAVSCNKKGVRHGALGGPRNTGDPEEEIVRWNQLMDLANERGILTIATGDNGNEAGFAVSASRADIVIPGNSSNWACYGIEACLAGILGKPEVMHDEYAHNRMLLNCANAGIPDGASAMCTPTTDGSSHEACVYTVGLLRQTVIMSSVELVRESRSKPGA